tara:strand:- start:6586 stop:6699 length:114 start_codon:yes stop_codon:yes gene_type:complete
MTWKIVGYYFDGKDSYRMYENESGNTKMIKEKNDKRR